MAEDPRQHSSFNEVDRTLCYQMAADIAARAGGGRAGEREREVNACNRLVLNSW
jgi:hypothetical protein